MYDSEYQRQYQAEHKEKLQEYQKQYKEANKEKAKEYNRQYRAAHKEELAEKTREYRKAYRVKNHELLKQKNKEYREGHKEEELARRLSYEARHGDKIRARKKVYRHREKEKLSQYKKDYSAKNKDKIATKQKEYRQRKEVRENARIYRKQYHKNRIASDIGYRLRCRLSSRIRNALKSNYKKSEATMKLVGCSIAELKDHLKSLFTKGMSWENYGQFGWHVDHIMPCASFDLSDSEQQRLCFHFSNLQPLWWYDNIIKSDTIRG